MRLLPGELDESLRSLFSDGRKLLRKALLRRFKRYGLLEVVYCFFEMAILVSLNSCLVIV